MTTPLRLACAAALLGSTLAAQTAHYHDQTRSSHVTRSNTLGANGYRLISLDVSGNRTADRYSAVWRKERRSAYAWCAGYAASALTSWCADWTKKGYRQKLITAAGSGASTVFACLMIKDGRTVKFSSAMTAASFAKAHATNQNLGYIIESAAVYGTAAAPLYAAVWLELPKPQLWGLSSNDTVSSYQKKFSTFVTKTWARPAFVTHSASQRYLSVFTDDSVGGWASVHNRTKASYQSEVTKHAKNSVYPIQVSVAGTGSAARYAAIFATGKPVARRMTVTGTSSLAFSEIDQYMMGAGSTPGFMKDKNARAAAIAIAKDGKLAFARAYTYARPGYPITQPTTGFRIASCSKVLAAIGIFDQDTRGRNFSVSSRLANVVSLGTPKDPRFSSITIKHLLNHRSGYNAWWGNNVTNKLASAQKSVAAATLSFAPGAQEDYSNGGYMMLGLALEARNANKPFFSILRDRFFTPVGVRRAHLLTTVQFSGDARCHEYMRWGKKTATPPYGSRGILHVTPSSVHSGNPLINAAFNTSPLSMDASGGIVMSPVDYVRVLSGVYDANVASSTVSATTRANMKAMIEANGRSGGWDYAGKRTGYLTYRKGGLWHSSHTYVIRRTDGISVAAFCANPNAINPTDLDDMIDRALKKRWPAADLFPHYGLPSFKLKYPGSTDRYGKGCPGGNAKTPHHFRSGTPMAGGNFSWTLTNGAISTAASFMLGGSQRNLDLSSIGLKGCTWLVTPFAQIPFRTNALGSSSWPVRLPSSPQIVGASFYSQYALLDPRTLTPLKVTLSNGLKMIVGGVK